MAGPGGDEKVQDKRLREAIQRAKRHANEAQKRALDLIEQLRRERAERRRRR